SDVDVRHGRARDHLADLQADVVNAIGVMFHIVDDREWADTVQAIANALKPGGVIVVGGHFGWLNSVNVQYCSDGTVNKRLRSARRWRQTLTRAGFANIRTLRNNAYLHASSSLPEANLLVA